MELKPSRHKAPVKPQLDGLGNKLRPEDSRNPWASLARGLAPRGGKRRRFAAETLGATPPRDGPFSAGAAGIAVAAPPRTRKQRSRAPRLPFEDRRG